MIDIETTRPTTQGLLKHIETFESFCRGHEKISPQEFCCLSEELSVGAVLLLGVRRYEKTPHGRRLLWRGPDQNEHDLGLMSDAKVMRDYPGYNAKCSLSLAAGKKIETRIIPAPRGKGTLMEVTLEDGTIAIAPNFRMALRNAALKTHLQTKKSVLLTFWNRLWGRA